LSIEIDRPNDNPISITFAITPSDFDEALQVVEIISGAIEHQ
jgi:hypothetical protein